MLRVQIPASMESARRYSVHVLLREFLGLACTIELCGEASFVRIMADDRELHVADIFFQQAEKYWLQPDSLPCLPLSSWHAGMDLPEAVLINAHVPVIYGEPVTDRAFFLDQGRCLRLGLDVFGSAFFMLTRYEEAIKPERDGHDRFAAVSSLACQEQFLDRPIVNEYLEILWSCLIRLWPTLKRKVREFRLVPTHDVDVPFLFAFASPARIVRSLAGDVLKRFAPLQAVRNLHACIQVKRGHWQADPYHTFAFMMETSERAGVRSVFHFMAGQSAGAMDGDYSIRHPIIRRLIRELAGRGHEIGLHLSYNTCHDARQMQLEFDNLVAVCLDEGVQQSRWGNRQHILRWKTPMTADHLEQAGLDYDTTLGYADCAGFRCGTCYEFPMFSLSSGQPMRLRQRPLIAMECTIMAKRYMNLGLGEKALQLFDRLKERCQRYGGDFVFLWHNSMLTGSQERWMYEEIHKQSAVPGKVLFNGRCKYA